MNRKAPQTSAPARRGRRPKIETMLPAAYVARRWGCSVRNARRLIARQRATPPPWWVVEMMLTCARLAGEGTDPDLIVDAFLRALESED